MMEFTENPVFTRLVNKLLSDDEYRELQEVLIYRPDLGDIIQGTGGLRKLRWSRRGRGKRGGVRVIYYWLMDDKQILMLYIYPKSQQEDLTPAQKKTLKSIAKRWSDEKRTVQ